jgi:hypothetical protein
MAKGRVHRSLPGKRVKCLAYGSYRRFATDVPDDTTDQASFTNLAGLADC